MLQVIARFGSVLKLSKFVTSSYLDTQPISSMQVAIPRRTRHFNKFQQMQNMKLFDSDVRHETKKQEQFFKDSSLSRVVAGERASERGRER